MLVSAHKKLVLSLGLLAVAVLTAMSARTAVAGPALLFDPETGAVLYAEDQDDLWHPASLTKLMTAYLTFEALKEGKITLDTKLTVSELANSQPPSKIGLPVGAQMDVELALQSLVIKSANDVAVMLAEGVGGTHEAFIERMNATAKKLGMTRTVFVNPNGLPAPEQVTTARDLAKLTRAVLAQYPQYAPLWGMGDMRVGRMHIRTHNALLKVYDGADGMKTGFTCDSGYNVVATATREGHKLAAIVLGEPSGQARSLRTANLLEHGFQYNAWQTALQPVTLDTLELLPDSKSVVTSVRNTVATSGCGGHRVRPVNVAAKSRQKRLATAKQKAPSTGGTTAVIPETTPATPAAANAAPIIKAAPKVGAVPAADKAVDKAAAKAVAKAAAKSATKSAE